VSRDEFDAQKALLTRAQQRINELELKLEQLEQNSD
jgi:BMFP domain-containing protein YqiC